MIKLIRDILPIQLSFYSFNEDLLRLTKNETIKRSKKYFNNISLIMGKRINN